MTAAAHPLASASASDDGRLSTAAAPAALLAGCLVQRVDASGQAVFVLTRWSCTREFDQLSEVERVLDVMGATAL